MIKPTLPKVLIQETSKAVKPSAKNVARKIGPRRIQLEKTALEKIPNKDCFVSNPTSATRMPVKQNLPKIYHIADEVTTEFEKSLRSSKIRKKYKTPAAQLSTYVRTLLENPIKDPKIESQIEKLLKEIKNTLSLSEDYDLDDTVKHFETITTLAEIDLSHQNKLYTITGGSYKYTKLKLADPLTRTKHKKILKNLTNTESNEKPKDYESLLFKNAMELDPLKLFLGNFSQQEPDLAKHLYGKYYLPRLSPKTKVICQKVSDQFNIKLFVENESSPNKAQIVYDELSEWDRASKGESKKRFLSTLDLSRHDSFYSEESAIGHMEDSNNSVHIDGSTSDSIKWIIRHELAHAYDYYPKVEDGNLNGIDIDKIIVKKVGPFGKHGDLMWDKCLYKDEFLNAGIAPNHIKHAYVDKFEFIAIAAQGDCSKYSPEFKEILVKLGLPKYVLEMEPCSTKFVSNANDIDKFRKKFPELKTGQDFVSFIEGKKVINENSKLWLNYFREFVNG